MLERLRVQDSPIWQAVREVVASEGPRDRTFGSILSASPRTDIRLYHSLSTSLSGPSVAPRRIPLGEPFGVTRAIRVLLGAERSAVYNHIIPLVLGFGGISPSTRITANQQRRLWEPGEPDPELVARLGEPVMSIPSEYLTFRSSPRDKLYAVMHEMGHYATRASEMPGGFRRYLDAVGQRSDLADYLYSVMQYPEFREEIAADLFAGHVLQDFRTMFLGRGGRIAKRDPSVPLRVMHPADIDDPSGPLQQRLRALAGDLALEIKNHSKWDPVYRDYPLDKLMEGKPLGRERAMNTILALRTSALTAMETVFPQDHPTLKEMDSRAWILSYLVGRARPDLIGKEFTVQPEGTLRVEQTGEVIDPNELNLPGIEDVLSPLDDYYTPAQMQLRRRAYLVASQKNLRALPDDNNVVDIWRERFRESLARATASLGL